MDERTCSVEGCDGRVKSRGMCNKHYARWRIKGNTDDPVRQDDHGTRRGYEKLGCRCDACRRWRSRYRKMMEGRPCSRCKERPRTVSGWCLPCGAEAAREHRRRNPDAYLPGRLKKHYGMTVADYERMLADQDGRCAICRQPETAYDYRYKRPKRLAVDHNHTTRKVRALLCEKCNRGLGLFDEDRERLRSAIEYLTLHA